MKFQREIFEESLDANEFSNWTCPSCGTGKLLFDEKKIITHELIESRRQHEDDDWDMEYAQVKFYGDLLCTNLRCKEKITIAGQVRVRVEHGLEDKHGKPYSAQVEKYYPEYIFPYLKLFDVPENFPLDLIDPLEVVFKLFWIDKSACGNAIRSVVEELLTDQGVRKTVLTKNRKKQNLVLHQRIEIFKETNPNVAKLLLAIKYIGNYGSHSKPIEHEDILDALDLLSMTIEKLYSDHDTRIEKTANEINKRKRPRN